MIFLKDVDKVFERGIVERTFAERHHARQVQRDNAVFRMGEVFVADLLQFVGASGFPRFFHDVGKFRKIVLCIIADRRACPRLLFEHVLNLRYEIFICHTILLV